MSDYTIFRFPEEAVLVGKGKSLDWMTPELWGAMPLFRVCVNSTFLFVPNPTAVSFQDAEMVSVYKELVPPNVLILTQPHIPLAPGFRLQTTSRPGYCTAPNTLMLMSMLGVRHVVLVGFDSLTYTDAEWEGMPVDGFYSGGVLGLGLSFEKDFNHSIGNGWKNYRAIADQMREVIATTGVEVTMLHEEMKSARG